MSSSDALGKIHSVTKAELEALIAEGLSHRQIANARQISQTTVRWWLDKHGLQTTHKRRRQNQGKYADFICRNHGLTKFVFEESRQNYRCVKCRVAAVSRRRRQIRLTVVLEHGGRCEKCGYDKSVWALEFHHRERQEKEKSIGTLISDRRLTEARLEAQKCQLLCANCHAEEEERLYEEQLAAG